jgi:hypothetical protein
MPIDDSGFAVTGKQSFYGPRSQFSGKYNIRVFCINVEEDRIAYQKVRGRAFNKDGIKLTKEPETFFSQKDSMYYIAVEWLEEE